VKSAKLAELKNNLSRYLDHVKAGGSVMVLERDRPVAQIVPFSGPRGRCAGGDDARLARVERCGVIRRGTGGLLDSLGRRRPPRLRGSVLRDLLAERGSGW
jgi:prevent-host-death family protein